MEIPLFDSTWKVLALMGGIAVLRLLMTGVRNLPGGWLGRLVPVETGPKEGWGRGLTEFLDSGLVALALVFFIIRPFVVQAFYIPSGSMKDTLLIDDRILVSKFRYRYLGPERGDIVVFKAPDYAQQGDRPEDQDFIKRLVGLPGDRVRITPRGVEVNGKLWVEPYARMPNYRFPTAAEVAAGRIPMKNGGEIVIENGQIIVPDGQLFVLGDNRNGSSDSHVWGSFPIQNLLGKAMLIFYSNPPPEGLGKPDPGIQWGRFGWGCLTGKPEEIPLGAERF
jgi:signal peptidase I